MHGIALDTLTYLGTDSLKARKLSNWNLYLAAQTDTILSADSIVTAFADSMENTVFGKLHDIRKDMKWNIASEKAISKLINGNARITTTDSLESLLKEVNDLVLRYVLKTDTLLDSTNRAKLTDVAELCPLYHGPAVYEARRYLSSIDNDPRIWLNDCEEHDLPVPLSSRFTQPAEEETELVVSVYPNPSQGDMTIAIFGGKEGSNYGLTVVNLLGEVVFESDLRIGQNAVNLPVAAGSYLYVVNGTDGATIDKGNVVVMQN